MAQRPGRVSSLPAALERITLILVVVVGVLALIRSLGRPWLLELSTHFQAQYLLVAVAGTLVLTLRRRWRWALIGLAAIVVTSSAIAPVLWRGFGGAAYASTNSEQGQLRIMHVNVLARNRQIDQVRDEIEAASPDIVVLHETTRRWLRGLEGIERNYPYRATGPNEINIEIAVYSRFPFERLTLHAGGDLSPPTIELGLRVDGRPVTVLTAHPEAPLLYAQFGLRNRQLTALAALAATLPRPLVLVGDLNTTMWSPWYGDLCETNDLVNSRKGFGVLPSWPAQLPGALRIPIDHCLVSPGIRVQACWLGSAVGSDHLPLFVDLVVPPALEPLALEQ